MFREIALLLVWLCAAGVTSAQEPPARLRLLQLTYADSGSTADVQIGEALAFTDIAWPFVTDYVELSPGEHSVTTLLTSSEDSASTTLTLDPGREYTVVAHGDYAKAVTFTLIDESEAPLAETGGAAIILNLTDAPLTDLRVDDRLAIDQIPPGGYGSVSLPSDPFSMAGQLGGQDYREEFTPLSNALLLGAVGATPEGGFHIIYVRSSHLTVAEYLKTILPGTLFSGLASALTAESVDAALPDDGAYTVFLPTNEALEQAGSLPTGAALLASHVTGQSLPPTELPNHPTLTMADGRMAQLAFSETASGYWEVDGAAILWDLRLANGVIYAIDGVLGAQGG